MTTRIYSQAVIQHPEDPSVHLSIVKAEIDKQSATRNAQHDAFVQMLRKDIEANTTYMQQVRDSRDRLLAERNLAYTRKNWRTIAANAINAVSGPLVLAWALFWLAGEKLGLWKLRRGRTKKTMPRLTKRGVRAYFAVGGGVALYLWCIVIARFIGYIHYLNG